ncbi:MAG: hypothetical protein ACK5D2_02435, partial [Bacteroidota bacterium]
VIVLSFINYLFVLAFGQLIIFFFSEIVMFNSFHARSFSCNKIDQVILRDQILTLNFCNNRFIQHSVLTDSNFNVDQFNQFCLHHLRQPN